MAANFPLSFRNDTLRKQRRKVLLEREKAMLPAIQIYVEYRKEVESSKKIMDEVSEVFGHEYLDTTENKSKIAYRWRSTFNEHSTVKMERNRLLGDLEGWKRQIKDIYGPNEEKMKAAIKETKDAIDAAAFSAETENRLKAEFFTKTGLVLDDIIPVLKELSEKICDTRAKRAQLAIRRDALDAQLKVLGPEYSSMREKLQDATMSHWRNRALYEDRAAGAHTNQPKREFIMKCPADDCRGFLSTAYKCGTCSKWACTQCVVCIGEDKDAAHTCNPDMVESAKMIRAETRPCPKCGTRIFKIDGCDQMWCIMDGCHTAFSWNTGHVVTGIVHNPHYYEWLRRNGGGTAPREAGDIPCGGLPATWQWMRIIRMEDIPNDVKNTLQETHRNMQELIADKLTDFPARAPQLMNKDDDVDYLMNRLTEAEWQRKLEISEARFKRKKEIGQILQTLVTAGSDIMNSIYQRGQAHEDIHTMFIEWLTETAVPELEQLRQFGNESLKALAKRDHMAVPQLEAAWKWKPLRALYRAAPKARATGAAAAVAAADAEMAVV